MTNSELTSALERLTCSNGDLASDTTLSELFDTSFKLLRLIEKMDLNPSSEKYQDIVRKSIKSLENCTKMVNELDLFSSNENIEEISNLNIRYLLLPVFLGNLSIKVQPKDFKKRLEQLQTAEMYFKDFLKRCKNYGVFENHISEFEKTTRETSEVTPPSYSHNATSIAEAREIKIQKYKALKLLNEREEDMAKYLNLPNADDSNIREYHLTLCEKWILTSIDELETIKKEKEILEHMNREKPDVGQAEKVKSERNSKSKPFAPMIITRNEIQKKVFGAGYPSLPVVSIEDFYKQRFEKVVKEHQQASQQKTLQDIGSGSMDIMSQREVEDLENEEKLERDDPIALRKARGWDDWKDDNPRGSGNRKNKG